MKISTSKLKVLLLMVIVMSLMVACGVKDGLQTPIKSLTNTPITTKIPAAQTPTITPKAILMPTITPSPTIAINPIWTPFPTIPPEEAPAYVKYLINEDPDCYLPCWMGITPGETTIYEAYQLLAPFATYLETYDESSLSMWFEFEDDEILDLALPSVHSTRTLFFEFYYDNDTITQLYTQIYGAKDRYPIQSVFNRYGKPSEILFKVNALAAFSSTMEIVYSNHGIKFVYQSVILAKDLPEHDQLEFCFQEVNGAVEAWDPKLGLTFNDLATDFVLSRSLTVEDTSGLTIDGLYNTFKDKDEVCIETSREMWLKNMKENVP